jgi:hypothetical protein
MLKTYEYWKNTDLTYKKEEVWVSKDKKFSYIFIPKNASVSFRNCGLFDGEMKNLVPYKKNTKSIVILRNPIDRVISMYAWLCGHSEEKVIPRVYFNKIKQTRWYQTTNDDLLKSFNLYLDNITNLTIAKPQYNFLKDRGLKIEKIDIKMLQENLNQDFNEFKNKYEIKSSIELKKANKTIQSTKTEIQDNLTKKQKHKIKDLYAKDFEIHNYVKNLKNRI